MAMFIVSFKQGTAYCTNIAVAENREQVEAEYGACDLVGVRPAKVHEVEALRQRGCPVVECGAEGKADKAKRMLGRLIDRIEEMELHNAEGARDEALVKVNKLTSAIEDMKYDCDGEVYETLLAIADILGR